MSLFLGLLCSFSLVDLLSAKDAVVVFVVDPSWDCVASYVANVPLLQEYKIVKVMTHLGVAARCNSDNADIYQNITYNSLTPDDLLAPGEICPQLLSLGLPIAAIIPTFDPAVALTDRLAACVGARGNPFDGRFATARYDKWSMSEAVRKAGLRSVKEKLVTTWSEAKEYLDSLQPPLSPANPVIFKILQGSGSEGVTKVGSLKEAKEAFTSQVGGKTSFGDQIGSILIQEFLKGKEYVVDSASRDGVHKVSMVFNEDLRPGNGDDSLYIGFKVMDPKDQKIKAIIDYSNKVLDAMGLRNGASDMEIFWLEEEGTPCLTDFNARWSALMWHDGLALEKALVGNDQITATINAYLDGDAFNEMPSVPSIKQHGAIMFVNNHHAGILRAIPGLAVAEKLPSYLGSYIDYSTQVGKPIRMNTWGNPPVTILLAHSEEAVMDADYDRIVSLENSDGFFDVTLSMGYTSLTSLRSSDGGLPNRRLPATAALVLLAFAGVLALAAMSRRNVRDGTEYLIIE